MPVKKNNSLILASLRIGRALADRDGITFRVWGACMYPTVRQGDVVKIQSRAAGDVSVGDIAVCRGEGFLFGHRVVGKGRRDGRDYVITRPDRANEGSDGPTFNEDLLGIVIAIERRGKPVPLRPARHPWLVRRYYAARLILTDTKQRLRLWLVRILARVQDMSPYGTIARCCFSLLRPRISYTVRVLLNRTLGDAVYRPFAPDDFDPSMEWKGRIIDRWTLALHMNDGRDPAAWTTFARAAGDVWGIEESHVRLRYRGMGLDDALQRQAAKIIVRSYNDQHHRNPAVFSLGQIEG